MSRPGDLGTTDCEEIGTGILAQPVAALTSLGYVLAGGLLVRHLRGLAGPQRWAAGTYAGLLGAVGLGSFAFHGPQGRGATLLHDLPIAALLLEATAVPLVRLGARRPVVRPASTATRAAAALGALAAVSYPAGRTGSPWCRPRSPLQAHGLWHLAGAGALALWGALLWPAPERPVRDAPSGS